MTRVVFEQVVIKGVRRWRSQDGKKHQETRTFSQTVNPWNRNDDGTIKTREQICVELEVERERWLQDPDANEDAA